MKITPTILLLWVVLAMSVTAEKLVLADFSKGMYPSVSVEGTPPEFFLEVVNMDFSPIGDLTPRRGYTYANLGCLPDVDSCVVTTDSATIHWLKVDSDSAAYSWTTFIGGHYIGDEANVVALVAWINVNFTTVRATKVTASSYLIYSWPYCRDVTISVDANQAKTTSSTQSGDFSMHKALIPYYTSSKKKLLVVYPSYLNDSLSEYAVTADSTLDTAKFTNIYSPQQISGLPHSGVNAAFWTDKVYLTHSKSEYVVYDGVSGWRSNPPAYGQIQAIPIDTGGNVTGSFRYYYQFVGTDTPYDSTNFGLCSERVDVVNGSVILGGFVNSFAWPNHAPPFDDSLLISLYRDNLDDDTGPLWIDTLDDYFTGYYTDTLAVGSEGSEIAPYFWGVNDTSYYYDCDTGSHTTGSNPNLAPPGSPICSMKTHTSLGCGVMDTNTTTPLCSFFEYAIVYGYEDGRESPPNAVYMIKVYNAGVTSYRKGKLDSLLMPPAPAKVTYRLILRRAVPLWFASGQYDTAGTYDGFYVIDTLKYQSTKTYEDIIPLADYASYPRFSTSGLGHLPDSMSDANRLPFHPTDIIIRQGRAFVIGDPANRNNIYYSEFGEPTIFPSDKVLNLPSDQGDWLIRMEAIGDQLVLFRQNSITTLSGLSFYQFRVTNISTTIGLSAGSSLSGNGSTIYFAHESGVYSLGMGGLTPVSTPIKTFYDSLSMEQLRMAHGVIVDGEYWLSIPDPSTSNTNLTITLVYSPEFRAWRRYDFGVTDAAYYSIAASATDYDPESIIAIVADTTVIFHDTLDDDRGISFTSSMTAKWLFAQPGRVKVNAIDIQGWGSCDSIMLQAYRDDSFDTVVYSRTLVPNWSDGSPVVELTRFVPRTICNTFAFKLTYYGSEYYVRSIYVDYTPWDRGKL